jgi:hypothetical protein
MAAVRRRRNNLNDRNVVRVSIRGIKKLDAQLQSIGLSLRSTEAVQIIHDGADALRDSAIAIAPQSTNSLRRGIYTTSRLRNGFVQLTRRGKRLNSPLRFPPRGSQVLLVSSVFYGAIIERGRKSGKRGTTSPKPYLAPALRRSRGPVAKTIVARLTDLIERRYEAARAVYFDAA